MLTLITFIVSGIIIIILIAGKVWEEKNRRSFFLLRVISKGDARIRDLSQNAAHHYADLKEQIGFIIRKQVPLHTRNTLNKSIGYIKATGTKYISDIKEGKLFGRKNEGISEFLKDISEMEKDNETMSRGEEDSQNNKDQVK